MRIIYLIISWTMVVSGQMPRLWESKHAREITKVHCLRVLLLAGDEKIQGPCLLDLGPEYQQETSIT